ncbi:unnamed protein product [Caenorhabditis brenneri]
MKIKYKKEENGCLVKYKNNEKLLENQDFGTVAGHDLGLILKQQKTKMEVISVEFQKTAKLRLSFDCLETVGGRFLASLKSHLEFRRTLLPVEHFEMKGTNQQSQIFKILQYLDPAHLKIMRIRYPLNSYDSSSITMKIDKIRELEQWKRVEMINIHGLNIDGSLRDFVHFKVAEFELKQVSVEDLLLLREVCLSVYLCLRMSGYLNADAFRLTVCLCVCQRKLTFICMPGGLYVEISVCPNVYSELQAVDVCLSVHPDVSVSECPDVFMC